MQTIWSRVAQATGTCRCPHCTTFANGVTRRATASATRRMPKYLTSSTLWYSGIFAAAATFDAGVKKDRREQWDKAIAAVKQDLAQPAKAEQGQRRHYSTETRQSEAEPAQLYTPFSREIEEDEDVFQDIDRDGKPAHWPANTGPPLIPHHLPPQSIYTTPDQLYYQQLKFQWLPKKLATVQADTDVLLYYIFLRLEERGMSQEAAKSVPQDFAKYFQHDLDTLWTEISARRKKRQAIRHTFDFPAAYHFPHADEFPDICDFTQNEVDSDEKTERLNSSLQSLFQEHRTGHIAIPALFANIAHNIATSSSPPNLDTYNILLLGLARAQEHKLFMNVVKSMRYARMRLNEVSMATILDHFTATNNKEEFIGMIQRMRGKHHGLGTLARPDIRITQACNGRLVRREDQPWKVMQLPYPTPFVFKSIMAGMVKFAGFDIALSISKGMGHEGWGLCMSGLTPLLQSCEQNGDWENGQAVWNEILKLKEKSRRRKGMGWESERIGLATYASMLRLCSKCKKKDEFERLWNLAIGAHYSRMERLKRLVKGEEDGDENFVD